VSVITSDSIEPAEIFHHRFKAMGSPCEIQFRGCSGRIAKDVVRTLEIEILRLEQKYSRFLSDSIISEINQSAGLADAVIVDEETERLLEYADTCYAQSNGLFDITSGSLRNLWNYHRLEEKQVLPGTLDINNALEKIGWDKVTREPGKIHLPIPGMEIDFGGIVKEYAADCVATMAEAEGIASGMVELGGDIRVFGLNSQPSPWQVGIRDPFNTDNAAAVIEIPNGGLATSGDYERYTIIRGKKYSHILNPLTGWPIEGFSSVSVLAQQCVVAGSAASIAVLLGSEGKTWLDELGLPYLCIDSDGTRHGTINN
jgi:thiamine biosynthesis lipoprotein